jgi:hypothetical protein
MNNTQYEKDYQIENNTTSIQRSPHDDTLYVFSQFLNQYHNRNSNKPILDLGSGDCHYHQYFQNHQFIGLDQNKTHKGKSTDLLIEQNIEEFPYNIPNEYIPFEFIISLDTFEHLIRPDKVLDYLYQDDHILSKGGYIFLSVPNVNTLDDKLNNINPAVYNPQLKEKTSGRWNATHLRFFDFPSIIQMSEDIGYKIVSLTGSNFHVSKLFSQLGSNLEEFGLDGLTYGNMLRNSGFVEFAPNICVLLQKG